jgi:hypothetical protein
MRIWAVSVAVVLGFAATVAKAEPLDFKEVSAQAKWVAHIDVDAMRASTVVEKAYYKVTETFQDAEKHIEAAGGRLGLDVRKDLFGLTLYGSKIGKPEGVLIVHANVDQKSVLEKAEKAPDHQVAKYGSYEVHSWTDKIRNHQHSMSGAFYKPSVIVFAPTVDLVKAALDVLDGKSPSLAGTDSPLAAKIPEGTTVVARAIGLSEVKLPWKSPLVTQCDTFNLVMGERQGESFAEAKLATKSAETAEQIKTIVEGARAMAELQHGNDPESLKMVKRLKVRLAGKTVSVDFRAPADEVWTHLEKHVPEMIKHHQRITEGKGGHKK